MSDTDTPETVPAIVLRDFTDASNEENFTAGPDEVQLARGRFLNFKAAGLVRSPDEQPADAA